MLEEKLHLLFNDSGAIVIMNIANIYGEVHLFVVYNVSEAHVVDEIFIK